MVAGSLRNPGANLLVGCVVVCHRMNVEVFGNVAIDETVEEILVTMTLVATTYPVATSSAANKVVAP